MAKRLPPDVVLAVAGEPVGRAQYERHLAFHNPKRHGGADKSTEPAFKQFVFDGLLMNTVIRQEARRLGISVSPQRARALFERVRQGKGAKALDEMLGPFTDQDFTAALVNAELLEKVTAATRKKGQPEKWLSTGLTRDLPDRWRRQTVCGQGFHSVACKG